MRMRRRGTGSEVGSEGGSVGGRAFVYAHMQHAHATCMLVFKYVCACVHACISECKPLCVKVIYELTRVDKDEKSAGVVINMCVVMRTGKDPPNARVGNIVCENICKYVHIHFWIHTLMHARTP